MRACATKCACSIRRSFSRDQQRVAYLSMPFRAQLLQEEMRPPIPSSQHQVHSLPFNFSPFREYTILGQRRDANSVGKDFPVRAMATSTESMAALMAEACVMTTVLEHLGNSSGSNDDPSTCLVLLLFLPMLLLQLLLPLLLLHLFLVMGVVPVPVAVRMVCCFCGYYLSREVATRSLSVCYFIPAAAAAAKISIAEHCAFLLLGSQSGYTE